MPLRSSDDADTARGCLLGGAVGDALGAPVEFLSSAEIEREFGPEGIRDFQPAYGRIGAITDNTQMTMFTAEGVLRAFTRGNEKGICHGPTVIYHAYLRWLQTQGVNEPAAPYRSRRPLRVAVDAAVDSARSMRGHEETVDALQRASRLAEESPRSKRALSSLGEGWVAEEALAIAVYCALSWPEDFEEGVALAVNHGGDSDSTGAITGNLLGASLGVDALPSRWLAQLELREEIDAVAHDLLIQYQPGDEWWNRYPGC
jgi:ADP-ribosylglycohydrolase